MTENDIFVSTSDGASVMLKFGRLALFESMTCYSHGLHLAVCDILYQKKLYVEPTETNSNNTESSCSEESDCESEYSGASTESFNSDHEDEHYEVKHVYGLYNLCPSNMQVFH